MLVVTGFSLNKFSFNSLFKGYGIYKLWSQMFVKRRKQFENESYNKIYTLN